MWFSKQTYLDLARSCYEDGTETVVVDSSSNYICGNKLNMAWLQSDIKICHLRFTKGKLAIISRGTYS